MSNAHSISDLSKHLFWDLNRNDLDFETSKEFIIHRVLEYGLMPDWEMIKERTKWNMHKIYPYWEVPRL